MTMSGICAGTGANRACSAATLGAVKIPLPTRRVSAGPFELDEVYFQRPRRGFASSINSSAREICAPADAGDQHSCFCTNNARAREYRDMGHVQASITR